jgi:hypothetical protein
MPDVPPWSEGRRYVADIGTETTATRRSQRSPGLTYRKPVNRATRRNQLGRAAGLLAASTAVVLSLTGCGGAEQIAAAATAAPSTQTPTSEPSAAAPTTVDPFAADQALVRTLYYDYSQAFMEGGLPAGTAFIAQHNYPGYSYTAEDCLAVWRGNGASDETVVNVVPDVTQMALDPGWSVSAPGGRYDGFTPTGRVYILPIQYTETDPVYGYNQTDSYQVHAAVLDDRAYFFTTCESA